MREETLDRIIERAKSRKDGIFVLDCIHYAVKDGRVLFLNDFDEIFQLSHGFLVSLGKVDRYKVRKKLQELLKGVL